MGKKNKKIHHTIEGQLEYYYKSDPHTERNGILWHAWCQNRRWLSQLLETTMGSFPTYSKHDESHAKTVLHNIELILGEKRIKELSASDCFMLLHTVYIHDIGMVITYEDRENIVKNDKFIDMIREMEDETDPVFQRAIRALQKQDYTYRDEEDKEKQMKRLYADKLDIYYAILHLIATYRRPEHGELSSERLEKWTLESEKLGSGFSMAGIPQRIFLWIAKCAGLHTDGDFSHIMNLPQEDNGYASDYLHPRFVAVLLQLGDILDMDNDRFHPLTRECVGALPELSQRHYEKHQAIRRLYIKQNQISIEADCNSQDVLRLVKKECDMLRSILKEAGYYWSQICPDKLSMSLPAIESVKLCLEGFQIPEELVTTQFKISQKKAFAILGDFNACKDQFVFLREFLQNAIDASKIQYWKECIRYRKHFGNRGDLKKMSPDQLEKILSTDFFPIEVNMEIAKQEKGKWISSIEKADVKALLEGEKNELLQYGVVVRIKDLGTGIDSETIKYIASMGDSRKRENGIAMDMPEWLKPSVEFGMGLQSAFILTNTFKCYTYTRSNEKYEITFSTIKSHYSEGCINVRPIKWYQDMEESYGTCFEVFVPANKKLLHELYPAAWDGKDFFDKEYEALRPLRHSAELLAQMVLYLETVIGERLFPIYMNVKKNPYISIPLNSTEKNQIRKMKFKLVSVEDDVKETANISKADGMEEKFKTVVKENFEPDRAEKMIKLFQEREWERSGKSWFFYYKKYMEENKFECGDKGKNEIVVEKTKNAIALLDCRDGNLYYWDNKLYTFCLINVSNFMLQVRQSAISLQLRYKKISPNVKIYYKGFLLEERELPGIGNELFQFIDIKGKLEREYVSLSRKGFTEKGKEHFLQEIYEPLLESVLKILKTMSKQHSDVVRNCVRSSLNDKASIFKELTKKIERWKSGDEQILGVADQNEWLAEFIKKRNQLREMFEENAIFIIMLGFFAQKDIFEPLAEIACEKNKDKDSCWVKVVEYVQKSCGQRKSIKDEDEYVERFEDPTLESSILFHIEHRPQIDLEREPNQEMRGSGWITFPDIFSHENQFMVVSKRENRSAGWKQYLTPIQSVGDDGKKSGIIQCLKKFSVMASNSDEKKEMESKILQMGNTALAFAGEYGKDTLGGNGAMNPGEYLQQYLLKWLLRYIPTVALFMSEDGNTRVNIIHGKTLPFVYMNMFTKKLILQRILEEANKYDIQRFSIPAWQGLENLSCTKLPYSHFFVKRGYMAEESYSKVIFPFAKDELVEIDEQVHSEKAQKTIHGLHMLKKLLNVRQQLLGILPQSEQKVLRLLNNMKDYHQRDMVYEGYELFMKSFRQRNHKMLRIIDKVRTEYQDFVIVMLEQGNWVEEFLLEDLEEVCKNWDDIYIWLLLRVICNNYCETEEDMNESMKEANFGITEEMKKSLGGAWNYILKNEYMQNADNVLKYKAKYSDDMEGGKGAAYEKRERILAYIEKARSNVLRRENLLNCWMCYVSEIFDLLQHMEEEQYQVTEGLADWDAIEKEMYGKGEERTNDSAN